MKAKTLKEKTESRINRRRVNVLNRTILDLEGYIDSLHNPDNYPDEDND